VKLSHYKNGNTCWLHASFRRIPQICHEPLVSRATGEVTTARETRLPTSSHRPPVSQRIRKERPATCDWKRRDPFLPSHGTTPPKRRHRQFRCRLKRCQAVLRSVLGIVITPPPLQTGYRRSCPAAIITRAIRNPIWPVSEPVP
jgi:hypothetical protein